MDSKKVIVVGTGGHAKVVIDILQLMGIYEIIGVTSVSMKKGLPFCGYPVIGEDSDIKSYNRKEFCIAMGLGGFTNNNLRTKVYNYFKELGFHFCNVIHPSVVFSSSSIIGEASVLFPGVVINTDVTIGNNTIIATGSTIDHETRIGNNVLVSAGVTIGAYVNIEDNCVIALGAKVVSGITVKKENLIAAGAVVVKNTLENQSLFGLPAKAKKNDKS